MLENNMLAVIEKHGYKLIRNDYGDIDDCSICAFRTLINGRHCIAASVCSLDGYFEKTTQEEKLNDVKAILEINKLHQ